MEAKLVHPLWWSGVACSGLFDCAWRNTGLVIKEHRSLDEVTIQSVGILGALYKQR
jgi:hypothetical protein